MSEKINADKVEILDHYTAMNDTSEKMEARINILEQSDKDLTKNINDTLYSDKLKNKVDKLNTNQSDIKYNVDHLDKTISYLTDEFQKLSFMNNKPHGNNKYPLHSDT
eukprot:5426685-Ditylum_brightwellii.AAC.1